MTRRPPGRAEISEALRAHGISPSRALGQNFVVDPNVVERVARLARVGPGDHVVEIGAGLGSLTVALAGTGANVLAVEIDRYLEPLLRELVEPLGVRVVRADAMACDWAELLGVEEPDAGTGEPDPGWVLVANLPYNIATPLVLDLLEGVPVISRMLVMVQREAGERLGAGPGSDAYGAVSVRLSYFAAARVVARIPPDV
ncbi:MAG TPA: rRNA adenine dimethyltransferase family protein, partial [Acidimicrobiales bacterium]|nr:rRNA adenine dimethyltransferase family protein [Acidimicrobiales bacterium]